MSETQKLIKKLEAQKMAIEQRIERLKFKEENAEFLTKKEKKSKKEEVTEQPRKKTSLLEDFLSST